VGGVSRPAFVLLPPSESKVPGGHPSATPGFFDESLGGRRRKVLLALKSFLKDATTEEWSHTLKVRGPLLDRAIFSTRKLVDQSALVMPVWQRYSGVVWSHLDPANLDDGHRSRLIVPSGLYGLSSGTDEIANYRLMMKVGLGSLGTLTNFWRPAISRALEEMPEATFVNLLPKEHDAAIQSSTLLTTGRMIPVSFLRHGGAGVAGHDAKAVKGVVARLVLQSGIETLETFRWQGWKGRVHRCGYEVIAPRKATR